MLNKVSFMFFMLFLIAKMTFAGTTYVELRNGLDGYYGNKDISMESYGTIQYEDEKFNICALMLCGA